MSFRLCFLEPQHREAALACLAAAFTPSMLSPEELNELSKIEDSFKRRAAMLALVSSRTGGQLTDLTQIGGARAIICTTPNEFYPQQFECATKSIASGLAVGAFVIDGADDEKSGDRRDDSQGGGGSPSPRKRHERLVGCFICNEFNPYQAIANHQNLIAKLIPQQSSSPGSDNKAPTVLPPPYAPFSFYYSRQMAEVGQKFLSDDTLIKDGPILEFEIGGVHPDFRAKGMNLIEKLTYFMSVHAYRRGFRYATAMCIHPVTHALFSGRGRVVGEKVISVVEKYGEMEYPFNSGKFPAAAFEFKSVVPGADSATYTTITRLSSILIHRKWETLEPLLPWVGIPALSEIDMQEARSRPSGSIGKEEASKQDTFFSKFIAPRMSKGPFCSTEIEIRDSGFKFAKSFIHPSYNNILRSKL